MDYEPQDVETKWRERWAREGRYEADPDDSDPTFITVPYPYPSGGMHLGHCRTYTVPDVYARYRRLQGENVLFPIAWHVTGTPIVGAVERLKEGDEEQMSSLQDAFGVPESDLQDLETPMGYARYFIEEADSSYKRGMRQMGLSIDWRREFTTNDERYSKFITWQYETLKERGLLEKGLHPVDFCTNERQPVTDHDLLEGEDADHQEFTLVRFYQGESLDADDATVFPMATLRPETVRGVTNAYVHPEATYVRATVDGEEWVVSEAATEKLGLQAREVDIADRFPGSELVGEAVTNPVTGDEFVILPATFVDADNATGVVMSVPAHSPDDIVALDEAKTAADAIAEEYGVEADEIRAIEPVPILEIEGYGTDDPALHEATEELYQDEFLNGHLLESYGEFAGEGIEEVRERFREHHRNGGRFGVMYEYTEEVVCRCGGEVEVSVRDTWFIRYNDPGWQAKAREAVERMDAIPENTRKQYDDTIDWLEEWPCIRNYGLGTRLPWDDEFVIEPLSDSTIYMAYYTIAPRIREIPVEDLDREFFDTLFFGPDGADAPDGHEVDIDDPDERALELREEWDYWYPVDFRCSANDLIRNHLTFYLYHHAELFEQEDWPQGITSMGLGLLEGKKMSSSKGHVVLPGEAIDRYGADTVRFFLLNSAEPWQDYDWRAEEVRSTREKLERFWDRAVDIIDREVPDDPDLEPIDRWLLSKLQGTVRHVTDALDRFETRTASQAAFYRFEENLRWYRRRTDTDRLAAAWTLRQVLATRLRLLAPFVPFMTNELHEAMTGDPAEDGTEAGIPAEDAAWPEPDPAFESPETEAREELIADLVDDIRDIVDVTGTDPETIRAYVAADWKHEVFETVREVGPDVGAVMGAAMEREALRERGEAVNELAGDLVELVRGREAEALDALSSVDEQAVYRDATAFLEEEFDAAVEVYAEDGKPVDPENRAGQAVPFRPAVHIA
ncbi:MAG: leucine--tRNA ligase [Halobacteriales archaeon SW_9_67_25]|nr:MAG: leucine--tRNA ligase [Halobacteriales archaeon SW_9_67_25]